MRVSTQLHTNNHQRYREIQKLKIRVTRKWLKGQFANKVSPIAISTLLLCYIMFCSRTNQIPLSSPKFNERVRSQTIEVDSDFFEDDLSSRASEEGKKKLPINERKNQKSTTKSESKSELELNNIQGVESKIILTKECREDESEDSGFESQEVENESYLFHNVFEEDKVNDFDEDRDELAGPSKEALLDFINDKQGDETKQSTLKQVDDISESFRNSRFFERVPNDDCNTDYSTQNWKAKIADFLWKKASLKRELDLDTSEFSDDTKKSQSEGNHVSKKRLKLSEAQEIVLENVTSILKLEGFKQSICYDDAKRFSLIMSELISRKQLQYLLDVFVHCFTCKEKHGSLCFMFKRIVHHMATKPDHQCAIKEIYGHILRLHLDTCHGQKCAFPNCKALREMRKNNKEMALKIKQENNHST